ncbi:hypothetical protein SGFS_023070 [Streptomyces graminofaciens]|uniref:Transposase IS701-like DDE domain-containing protein n=1 Tax=Streptomyces graminofaciens TaxID=68212 RepID=A0ABM7F5E7_9ACTN|nr:hypothetical protein SGFS_023070 [Streptomyces graminofaciens]
MGHVEKWQLALDMIEETQSWGIGVPLAVADAGYGDALPPVILPIRPPPGPSCPSTRAPADHRKCSTPSLRRP